MNAAPQRRWHEQAASLGSLIVAVVVMLIGAVGSVVGIAVGNEKRFSDGERAYAVLSYQVQELQRANAAQDERMTRREAENRIAFDQALRMLSDISSRLAVIESRSGVGLRQPLPGQGGSR